MTSTTPATTPVRADIHVVVQLAASGRLDQAIRLLLILARDEEPFDGLRLDAWSEEEFVKLPNWQAERDNLVAAARELNAVVQEVLNRAEAATAAGDLLNAEQLFLAIKRLGAANVGPKRTKFADAYGRSLVRRADAGLAGLPDRRSPGGAAVSQPDARR